MKFMIMPNFLIIGAAKAGTTSLYDWLQQHPQIYMSPTKETNFFALEGDRLNFMPVHSMLENYLATCITSIDSYREQYQKVSHQIAIGEVSPMYLYHSKAPERIYHYVPDAKLIAILRDPVERAYSNFLHHVLEGSETCSDFSEALEEERNRSCNQWWWGFLYVDGGFYYTQLKRYFDLFDSSQIKVYLYEDLKNNCSELLRDVFQFLGVNETFIPDTSNKYNVTGIPKNKLLHEFLSKPNLITDSVKHLLPGTLRRAIVINLKNVNLVKPKLSQEVRNQLIEVYREDILKLEELIQRDLSEWLK